MARPSSKKGRFIGESPSRKASSTKRIRAATVDAPDAVTPELFPGPGSRSERSPGGRSWKAEFASEENALEGYSESEEGYQPVSTRIVSKSWVKFIVGFSLLPFAWVLTETFLQTFIASFHNGLLANPSAGYFAAGALLFGILFAVIPRQALMIPYVLGHEVTHALWVKLFGGKVADQFHVSQEGGHVLTDRVNTWIILAPYFFPIYSVLVVTLYGAASLATDMSALRPFLFLLLGGTIAFHLVFTCLLIARGQPDLHYGGTFFSIMVIYLVNLTILTCLLLIFDIALAEDVAKQHKLHEISWLVTVEAFGGRFLKNAFGLIDFCITLTAWIENLIAGFNR